MTKIATLFGRKGKENTARAGETGSVLEWNIVHESYCNAFYIHVKIIPVWSLNSSYTAQY